MTYKIAYSTGTYDLIHQGHFEMLQYIQLRGYNKIIIGLVTDEFAEKRKRKPILSYNHRKSILENSKYNVFVVPCERSDKIYDYNLLKFDALFITDEYYDTDEYNNFSKQYPNIPVYYKPRTNSFSTTDILTQFINNITYISHDVLNINDNIIKIINSEDIDVFNYINNVLKNQLMLQWYIDNSSLVKKHDNIFWWNLPSKNILNKENINLEKLNEELNNYMIYYDGTTFIIKK